MDKVALFFTATLLLSFLAFNTNSADAHEEVVVGNISIVGGWLDEPPLVSQLNGIVLIITNVSTGQPISNAVAQLEVTLQKGTDSRPLEFQPAEEAGTYTATILPTQTGQYALIMRGAIAGQAIDGQMQIEDVEDTARFNFPPATTTGGRGSGNQIPQGLVEQLQVVIADLTAQVEEANVEAQNANNATRGIIESIEDLRISADRAYLFSLIGVGAGVAGIAIGAIAMSRREKIS